MGSGGGLIGGFEMEDAEDFSVSDRGRMGIWWDPPEEEEEEEGFFVLVDWENERLEKGSGVGLIEGVEKEEEDFSVVVGRWGVWIEEEEDEEEYNFSIVAFTLEIERGSMERWGCCIEE